YAPLSGSIVSERVFKVLAEGTDAMGPIGHGWTYSAHPIAVAAGVANLKLVDSLNLLENVTVTGPALTTMLQDAVGDHPNVAEVRGCGMLSAVEFAENPQERRFYDPSLKVGAKVTAALMVHGVVGRAMPGGDILGFAPPLCLTMDEARAIVDATVKAVRDTFDS
ncbi:MAG: aminotransferase class III-fold pyridoxal phosphate-dependent enzyme, partial [Pseudomonadota bacterium]